MHDIQWNFWYKITHMNRFLLILHEYYSFALFYTMSQTSKQVMSKSGQNSLALSQQGQMSLYIVYWNCFTLKPFMHLHNSRQSVAVQRDGHPDLPKYPHYNIPGVHLSYFYSKQVHQIIPKWPWTLKDQRYQYMYKTWIDIQDDFRNLPYLGMELAIGQSSRICTCTLYPMGSKFQ